MPMSPEHREKAILDTRESAAVLLEDLQHFREVLGRVEPSRGELRRLTNTLRRILIEQDIIKIANPRLGHRFMLTVNDTIPMFRSLSGQPHTYYFNGGATIFGMTARKISMVPAATEVKEQNPDDVIDLNVDSFLSQNILCLNGEWVNRRSVIKYIAYVAGGEIHAGVAKTQTDKKAEPILTELRRIAKCTKNGYQIDPTTIIKGTTIDEDRPFEYSPDAIDVVLLELLATVHFVISSSDTKSLETIIRQELEV